MTIEIARDVVGRFFGVVKGLTFDRQAEAGTGCSFKVVRYTEPCRNRRTAEHEARVLAERLGVR